MNIGREQRVVEAPAGPPFEIGRWLWCLEDARRRTLQRIEGLDPKLIDWRAPESDNSIGTILYHIAAIGIDYLYSDLLAQPAPRDIMDLFPYEIREQNGQLTPILSFDLGWHQHRLSFSLERLQDIIRGMDLDDFRRVRHLTDRPVDLTPEWTLFHLTQHEAEHRGELSAIRGRAEAANIET